MEQNGHWQILIIEHNMSIREDVSQAIDGSEHFRVVKSCDCAKTALQGLAQIAPDIVLTDVLLPDMHVTDLIGKIRLIHPHARVLIVSDLENKSSVFAVLKAGVTGYIKKKSDAYSIVAALQKIVDGGVPLEPTIARTIVSAFRVRSTSLLTEREVQVLTLMSWGLPDSEIARRLGIAKATTRSHMRNIYLKLDVTCKAKALEFAAEHQVIDRISC